MTRLHNLLLARSLWLLLALPSLATAQQTAPGITLGTWNLEFLGAEGDFRNKLPVRDEADYRLLGMKLRQLGVAVLAVQEICGEAPLQKVAAAAGPTWQVLLGTTGGWDDGKVSQQIGFLYDDAVVELLDAEELLEFPRQQENLPIFHRIPVTACFRVRATGFDFRAVTVHLKAGQKDADKQKRRLEASILHQWIASLQREHDEDQDIVVLGDFNSSPGAEPQQLLERGGALQYIVPKDVRPTIMHFPEQIDQIAVAPAFDELRATSFKVHDDFGGLDKMAWRKVYSDHFPVTVQVIADRDTDPQARFRASRPEQRLPLSRRPASAAAGTAPVMNWPPPIGANLVVNCAEPFKQVRGKLAAALPSGDAGFLVLQTEEGLLAIPVRRVVEIYLR